MHKTPFSKITNKTGKHKDWYKTSFIEVFCNQINPTDEYFKSLEFINKYKKLHISLELKQRLKLIADLLDEFLDMPYTKKLDVLRPLLGKEHPLEEGMFDYGFHLYPVSQFIEKNGNTNLNKSLSFIEELTKRFTGEWAVRPLASANEKEVLKKMKEWSDHKNFHVRRLSSEGLRPRLPWGTGIAWINESPKKAMPIYNKLRNDESLYVRRSVANAMGDIIKIDEPLAFRTFQLWLKQKQTKENLWVIKHAVRHPAKHKVQKYVDLREDLKQRISSLNKK